MPLELGDMRELQRRVRDSVVGNSQLAEEAHRLATTTRLSFSEAARLLGEQMEHSLTRAIINGDRPPRESGYLMPSAEFEMTALDHLETHRALRHYSSRLMDVPESLLYMGNWTPVDKPAEAVWCLIQNDALDPIENVAHPVYLVKDGVRYMYEIMAEGTRAEMEAKARKTDGFPILKSKLEGI